MKEAIFNARECNTYERDGIAQAISKPRIVAKNGRSYSQITYASKISSITRIINLIKALIATIPTIFLGLFSERVRELWYEGIKGRELVLVFTENSFLDEMLSSQLQTKEKLEQVIGELRLQADNGNQMGFCCMGHLNMVLGNEYQAYQNFKSILKLDPKKAFDYVRMLHQAVQRYETQALFLQSSCLEVANKEFQKLSRNFKALVNAIEDKFKVLCNEEDIGYLKDPVEIDSKHHREFFKELSMPIINSPQPKLVLDEYLHHFRLTPNDLLLKISECLAKANNGASYCQTAHFYKVLKLKVNAELSVKMEELAEKYYLHALTTDLKVWGYVHQLNRKVSVFQKLATTKPLSSKNHKFIKQFVPLVAEIKKTLQRLCQENGIQYEGL